MTIRNLDRLFSPASVAVIGASERAGSIGSVLTRNLVTGGFAGPVWGVNPHYGTTVHGVPCFASVAALPDFRLRQSSAIRSVAEEERRLR